MATQRPKTILPGLVETIIESPHPNEPEKVKVALGGADDLYREIRVENTLRDKNGGNVRLKPGARVKVTIKVERPATIAKR
jgi:hypothetical protein